ncbi:hypothetical protein ENKNEFLB_02693 [Nocardioides aquaticus]|uniref:Uncharacterized protein n=1 Tax=Nocardioides aquaticus TaxID=160826 RepID=A0ABX8ENU3_9ACTN|nr:hypothetical protein [Nocardioides aquaticus]QVT80298.1 hypothetical protein ENKNEFLB_02693 [Nocardioides aquaticus]
MTAGDAAQARRRLAGRAPVRAVDVVDLFVYVVVLNLAVEHVPSVLSEGFTLSLLTALLLKVVLEVVVLVKGRVRTLMRSSETPRGRLLAALLLWLLAVGSKIVVLEAVDLLFGDAVSLGGFFSVTGLVVVLLLCRAAVRRVLRETPPAADDSSGSLPPGGSDPLLSRSGG